MPKVWIELTNKQDREVRKLVSEGYGTFDEIIQEAVKFIINKKSKKIHKTKI